MSLQDWAQALLPPRQSSVERSEQARAVEGCVYTKTHMVQNHQSCNKRPGGNSYSSELLPAVSSGSIKCGASGSFMALVRV